MKHFLELSATAERVVDAAEALVQTRGYSGFSYDDVARAVGIRKPSIHHHFATKPALVTVVTQRYTHRVREQLLRIEGRHASAVDRLVAYAGVFAATFSNGKRLCLCGMLGAEAEGLPPEVMAEVDRFFQHNVTWLTATFTAAQQAGQVKPDVPPGDLAHSFLCVLEGTMVVGRGLGVSRGPADVAATFLSTVRA